jgi:hypothetical protein
VKSVSKILRLPKNLGQAAVVFDPGQADGFPGGIQFHTNLSAQVFRNGKALKAREVMDRNFIQRLFNKGEETSIDLGSGLVTNVGVECLSNDFIRSAQLNLATLNLANQHMTGKGTNVASALDIALQTISTNGGQTAVAGTQSAPTAANSQKYQSVATIAYTGSEAVTEWGLFTAATPSAATGSPLTAVNGNTVTVTGTPLTASSATVRGLQGMIVVFPTTGVWGLVISNTTSTITVAAWYKITDGTAGSAPGSTEAFTIQPVMWDRKTFAAVNVVSGDSIQFSYVLTVTSGG